MKDRIILDRGIETGVIAEWPFWSHFAGLDKTLQNEIGIGGNVHVDCFAFHQLHRFLAQKSSKQDFVESVRQWCGCSKSERGIAPERDRDRHALATLVVNLAVTRTDLVHLPVHRRGALIENLHPVHSNVASTAFGIASMHVGESDETSAVLWPALENGKIAQRKLMVGG